ncbi:DUF2933 domain-containing protein [Niveibacterium sp. SC-1]|uniref:DUF2933 domain-containing protein n=1 Tax=Niveibacterium sp. SC-1 TaxID=3135646 RepID=UPI00311E9644
MRTGWWVLAAVALVYLLSEHRAHLLGFLPYALLLLCPLMHVFMHGGHGHGSHGDSRAASDAAKRESHGTDDEEARK